ncbi:hypothetical protein CHU98_g8964 [Xylaria longipes]|nr:hypothetical protein CHU98_g8964 [Xylaria longipes]
MSRQAISGQRHILRALSQWPKDTIRPEIQFQTVLQKRFEQPKLNLSEEEQLRQANALYSLLENRYKRTVSVFSVHAYFMQYTTSRQQFVLKKSVDEALVPHHGHVTPAQEQSDLLHRPAERARRGPESIVVREVLAEDEGRCAIAVGKSETNPGAQ